MHIGTLNSPDVECGFFNTICLVNVNAEAHLSCYFFILL